MTERPYGSTRARIADRRFETSRSVSFVRSRRCWSGRNLAGQGHREGRAAVSVVSCLQPSAMRLDDVTRDREADPEAVRFGGDEGLEQLAVDATQTGARI